MALLPFAVDIRPGRAAAAALLPGVCTRSSSGPPRSEEWGSL